MMKGQTHCTWLPHLPSFFIFYLFYVWFWSKGHGLGHHEDKFPYPPPLPSNRIAIQEASGQSIKVSQEHLQSLSICTRAALEEGVAEELCNLCVLFFIFILFLIN